MYAHIGEAACGVASFAKACARRSATYGPVATKQVGDGVQYAPFEPGRQQRQQRAVECECECPRSPSSGTQGSRRAWTGTLREATGAYGNFRSIYDTVPGNVAKQLCHGRSLPRTKVMRFQRDRYRAYWT